MVPALIVGIVSTLASTAMSISAAQQQKKASQDAAAVQSALYQKNAENARKAGDNAIYAGEVARERHRINVSKLEGAQAVAMASQGLGLSEDISYDTRFLSMLDDRNLRYNAELEADKWYTSSGENLLKADAAERSGGYAAQVADYQMAGSAFQAIGNTALMYNKWGASQTKTQAAGL